MVKKFLFCSLFCLVSVLNAQVLKQTALQIEKFKAVNRHAFNFAEIRGFGSDEDNYYVFDGITGAFFGTFDASFFVIDKNLTNVKEFPLTKEKEDKFLWVQALEEDLVILLARDKKGEQRTQIIKQAYAKTTGKLKKETIIASFQKSKSEHWYFYSSTSPDKTKKAFVLLLAGKKNTVDSYYAAVLNQDCEMEWDATHNLDVSNVSFNVGDIAVTNKGDMYIAFNSNPQDEKTKDQKSYIDLIYLTDGTKEKMNFEVSSSGQIRLKGLKNNDIYLAGIFSSNNFISIKIDGRNFNVLGSSEQNFVEKDAKTVEKMSATEYMLTAAPQTIIDVLELDNGNIGVVCERVRTTVTNYGLIKNCWSVTTVFVKGDDASIESVNVMQKRQTFNTMINATYQTFHLSIFPFVYGDKVGYLFNDCLKRYATPAKYKPDNSFRSIVDGEDVSIVLNLQENEKESQITNLTGNTLPAKRFLRQILFQENNRLILLTRNRKTSYIETLSLP